MAKQKIPATQRAAERVTEPGRYRFDRGLYLNVTANPETGSVRKSWVQCLTLPDGTAATRGVGSLADRTVQQAIAKAHEHRQAVLDGRDPFADRKRNRAAARAMPTFGEVAETIIARDAPKWKGRTEQNRRQMLADYVLPTLGAMRINAIQIEDVAKVLEPLVTEHPGVATRARGLIRTALAWAVVHKHRTDNPADPENLKVVLPKRNGREKHKRFVAHAEVREAVRTINASGAALATKLALEFVIHTAARRDEVRLARWSEFDLDARVWSIPAERMKMDRDQRVPLSDQAMAIIERAMARRRPGRNPYVFDSGSGKPIGTSTMLKVMERLELDGSVHGFRSSFSSWCADNGEDSDLREASLAHFNRDRIAAAYQQSDLLERRRKLMQSWSDYVAPMRKQPGQRTG